jgi:hypothetical protein
MSRFTLGYLSEEEFRAHFNVIANHIEMNDLTLHFEDHDLNNHTINLERIWMNGRNGP